MSGASFPTPHGPFIFKRSTWSQHDFPCYLCVLNHSCSHGFFVVAVAINSGFVVVVAVVVVVVLIVFVVDSFDR